MNHRLKLEWATFHQNRKLLLDHHISFLFRLRIIDSVVPPTAVFAGSVPFLLYENRIFEDRYSSAQDASQQYRMETKSWRRLGTHNALYDDALGDDIERLSCGPLD